MVAREPVPFPVVPAPAIIDASESYYEEAQPYEETVNGKNSASVSYFFFSILFSQGPNLRYPPRGPAEGVLDLMLDY